MIDAQTPFLTWLPENPDFNEGDRRNEIKLLFQRQKAIAALLAGELDADTLLDLLEYQEVDPVAYTQVVVDNVDFLCQR